jgi:signal transduction histidine kinase/HAMP domain-containing protein
MKFGTSILKSRVALRIFLLFGLCALLPITAQSVLSFSEVTNHLREQTQLRLKQSVKSLGMAIFERLLLYDAVLTGIATDLRTGPFVPSKNLVHELGYPAPQQRFLSLALFSGEEVTALHGQLSQLPTFSSEEQLHLAGGKTLLRVQHEPGQPARLFMARLIDPGQPARGILAGEINGDYLWKVINREFLAAGWEVCVFDSAFKPIRCTDAGPPPAPLQPAIRRAETAIGQFEWTQGGTGYLASFWSIPLKFTFVSPHAIVVLSESRAAALKLLAGFQADFTLIMLVSLSVVVLLSISQIRKSLVPLEKIREGTRRIAMKDFASRVEVDSKDEFEEVAGSFNAMAGQLGRQFQALSAMAEIDRNILSVLDVGKIVNTVLTRMRDVLPCDSVNVTLRESKTTDRATVYLWDGTSSSSVEPKQVSLTDQEVAALAKKSDQIVALEEGMAPSLKPPAFLGIKFCLVLPISLTQGVPGVIALGYRKQPTLGADDVSQARQLADQVAVALSNAYETAERKKAEASLQESNRQLKEALDELAAMQKQIVQQERLRALGQMASGVAHDFNNALSPILGFSSILLEDVTQLDDKDKVLKYLQVINTAGKDAANVVARLREFYRSRDQQESFLPFDLNKLVEQSVSLTQPKWKDQALDKGVTIVVKPDLQKVPTLLGNESEIREVLTNLIFNAVDAMPKGGTIMLRTSARNGQVVLEVCDTGTGMTEEVRQRCLEPFFTTKGDRGTGLGLAMVYGIIRRHKGTIDIRSELEKGTTFAIGFPLEGDQKREALRIVDSQTPARRLRVLAVDDDPVTLMVTVECMLSEHHDVETAVNGRDAFEKYKAGKFDLVVTDQGMPEMNGLQLAAAIKQAGSAVPVILLTGYGQALPTQGDSTTAVDLVISKPITKSGLRDAIAKVIK